MGIPWVAYESINRELKDSIASRLRFEREAIAVCTFMLDSNVKRG